MDNRLEGFGSMITTQAEMNANKIHPHLHTNLCNIIMYMSDFQGCFKITLSFAVNVNADDMHT